MEDFEKRFDRIIDRLKHDGFPVRSWRPPTENERLDMFIDYPAIKDRVIDINRMRQEGYGYESAVQIKFGECLMEIFINCAENGMVWDEEALQTCIDFAHYAEGPDDAITKELQNIMEKIKFGAVGEKS